MGGTKADPPARTGGQFGHWASVRDAIASQSYHRTLAGCPQKGHTVPRPDSRSDLLKAVNRKMELIKRVGPQGLPVRRWPTAPLLFSTTRSNEIQPHATQD